MSLNDIIRAMSDEECKRWIAFQKNKELLYMYWEQTYPDIDKPTNVGEIIYVIKYDIHPLCKYNNHKKFKQFPKGYYTSCNKSITKECICLNELRADHSYYKPHDKEAALLKYKETMLEKYGVDNAFKMKDHAQKTKDTLIEKYGQPTLAGLHVIQDKIKQTSLMKFGVDHYTKSDEYKEKIAITNLSKYGTEYAIVSDEVIAKRKQTMIERYGVDNYFKSPDHQATISENRLKTCGYSNPGQRFLSAETYAILQDVELFKSYITGVSYESAANAIGTSAYTVVSYIKKYDLFGYARPGTGSVAQDEIEQWLINLGINVIRNCRSIIPPKEIDLFLPDYNLGIEYNGIYHHTEFSGNRDKNYHRNKYTACKQRGIKLIQICSISYKNHKELIKNIILSKLGKTITIGARKCNVRELSFDETSKFLENNHLQSSTTTGKYRYGLFYNNELVQLMTFGNLRKSLGASSKENKYELIRMSTKQGLTIVGGTSKLFKYFLNIHCPHSVLSYCDLRYFTGESLHKCGFEKIGETDAGYWYTDYKKIYHRYNFTKSKLVKQGFDKSMTEEEIMKNIGYDKLWDCGQAKWEWVKK
jgi:hypothetical protein